MFLDWTKTDGIKVLRDIGVKSDLIIDQKKEYLIHYDFFKESFVYNFKKL